MPYRTRPAHAAVAVLFLLTGCSGPSDTPPAVATLESAAPRAAASAPATDARPVFPIDATAADMTALTKPWVDCMVEHAGPGHRDSGEELIGKGGIIADDPKSRAALETCLPHQPETFEQHQQRTDLTAFKDNQREWYRCAQAAGYELTAPDPDTGEFGLTTVGPEGDFGSPKIQACRRAAFID